MNSIMGAAGILLNRYDDSAVAIFDALSAPPNIDTRRAVNWLIKGMKRKGYFSRYDSLYIPKRAGHQEMGLLDWRRLVSAALNGSASWDATNGFLGSASPVSFINTNFTPSVDAVTYTANKAGIGAYLTGTASSMIWGAWDGAASNTASYCQMETINNNFPAVYLCGTAGSNDQILTISGSLGTGLIQHNRTASNQQELYRNGFSVGTKTYTLATRALCSRPFYLCAANGNGSASSYGAAKIGAWWAGDVFSGVEQADFKSMLEAYFAM